MSFEWPQYQLSDIGRIVTGKTPSTSQNEFFGGSVPFLTPTDMIDGHKTVSASRTLTNAGLATVKNCLIPRGVAVSCIGWQMGKSVLVLGPTVTNQQINTIVVNESRFDISFIYYLLSSIRNKIFELGATATRTPIVNKSTFGQIKVFVPSITEQKNIAAFFSSLDDRISLLRETNTTLEAIAQALFKSWFIDFDPVRAKTEGLEPEGMDAATAALFPDSFEESELGLVPMGWKAGCVADIAVQKKGSVNPLASPNEWFEHYSLPAFDSGQSPVLELGELIKSNKTPLPEEAILLSKLNPHIPRVWLPVKHGGNAVCSTEFLAYSPKAGGSKELIYCLFSSAEFQQQLCQLVTGTSNSHQRVKPDQVLKLRLAIADDSLLIAFADIASPIFERVYANRLKAQTLTQLRDTLLPRLISGQMRLPEAEAQIETVCV